MKKSVWGIVIVIVVVIVAAVVWFLMNSSLSPTTPSSQSTPNNNATETPATSNGTDMTATTKPQVAIRDLSFSPANIKVKVGSEVTWTNNDTMAHSVVADDSNNTGGIPTDAQMFGNGQTFKVKFTEVGTFNYHCIPHTFMHGSVEVVE